jgi:hypothetical protein
VIFLGGVSRNELVMLWQCDQAEAIIYTLYSIILQSIVGRPPLFITGLFIHYILYLKRRVIYKWAVLL